MAKHKCCEELYYIKLVRATMLRCGRFANNNHGDYTPFEWGGAMLCPECEKA